MTDETKPPTDSNEQPRKPGHYMPAKLQREMEIEKIREVGRFTVPEVVPAPEVAPAQPGRAMKVAGGILAVLLVAGGARIIAQVVHVRNLAEKTERDAVATVAVASPKVGDPDEEVVLPCSLEAFEESPIYARTNGYLIRWYKDIGTHVKKGELLADIDTPEIDQELHRAEAVEQQTQAQMELAKISADRWQNLVKTNSVSEQENDVQSSGYRQAVANLADAKANVHRLKELEGFKRVYAPFDGVITRRNVDPGALINAGAGATGRELFDMARVDPLRIFAAVPQAYSPYTRSGTKATITLQEYPGQVFEGVVARTSESINRDSRTLLTEVDIPNKDGKLLPGSLGEVHFKVGQGATKLTIPIETLLFRSEGPCVAVVGAGNKVALRHISIGRDYGTSLEILQGISPTDRIVMNPPDSIADGQPVNIATAQAEKRKEKPE